MGSKLRTSFEVATVLWRCLSIIPLLSSGALMAATAPSQSKALSCVAPPPDDPALWIWRSRILASFPPDTPRPKFLGGFSDANSQYELHLWRDAQGIFGELQGPVLEADSPTSRLYEAYFDGKSGAVSFTALFPDGKRRFAGRIDADSLTGMIEHPARNEKILLQKLPPDRVYGAGDESYSSRAQFECAMILFRRY